MTFHEERRLGMLNKSTLRVDYTSNDGIVVSYRSRLFA